MRRIALPPSGERVGRGGERSELLLAHPDARPRGQPASRRRGVLRRGAVGAARRRRRRGDGADLFHRQRRTAERLRARLPARQGAGARDRLHGAAPRRGPAPPAPPIGAEPLHWPLLEAPHRGYDSAKALFGPTRDDDAIEDALADRLTDLLEQIAPDRVYGPFGVGGHVDHRKVRAALERVAPRNGSGGRTILTQCAKPRRRPASCANRSRSPTPKRNSPPRSPMKASSASSSAGPDAAREALGAMAGRGVREQHRLNETAFLHGRTACRSVEHRVASKAPPGGSTRGSCRFRRFGIGSTV